MDDARTASFKMGPQLDRARSAVLLLHGFTGSPWEVRPLGELLAQRGHHVYAPRLPGHGDNPEAMAYVTLRDWEHAAFEALDGLKGPERVYLAGLSMGALLSIVLADRSPRRIRAMALMAPVVGFRAWDARLFRALRGFDLELVHARWQPKTTTDLEDPSERSSSPILPRYPLARLRDLWRLQDEAWAVAARIRQPALVLAARHDHVVRFARVKQLARRMPHATLLPLERGFHIIPRDYARTVANTAVADFFAQHP